VAIINDMREPSSAILEHATTCKTWMRLDGDVGILQGTSNCLRQDGGDFHHI